MPLLRYPYLEYDGRKTMRSLADALTKLRELGNLSDRENVEIKTMGIRLQDGRLSGIVSVLGPQQQDGTRRVIFMPSSCCCWDFRGGCPFLARRDHPRPPDSMFFL